MKLHLPELKAAAEDWARRMPGVRWHPEQVEPRPEWHGREVIRLGVGVFRFTDEKSPAYHLVPDRCIV